MHIKRYSLLALPLLLNACAGMPSEYYANRGDPENQLSASSDLVTIDLATPSALDQLSRILTQSPPDRAMLGCSSQALMCEKASALIAKHHVSVSSDENATNSVILIYEHVVANSCENHYVDYEDGNGYNLNHPSFGCSIRLNSVHMVTDKKQFTHPNSMDSSDGEKVGQTYDTYLKPTPSVQQNNSAISEGSTTATASGAK